MKNPPTHAITALIKTMRPKQWVKNIIVFAALVFDAKLLTWYYAWRATAGFVLFILISGVVYIINDLVDIEKDRQHPKKRTRPLASGQLSPRLAISVIFGMTVIALVAALWLSPLFTLTLFGYLGLQLTYSLRLKHIVLLDVLSIAAGFVLRVTGGALLVNAARFSPWLYICTTLGALFLGFGKRRGELVLLGNEAVNHRPILENYSVTFLDQLINIVTSATILAYAFYTFSAPNLQHSHHLMMLTIPYVIYGLFRYLYLIHIHGSTLAPDEVLLTDRPIQATLSLWGLTVIIILYLT